MTSFRWTVLAVLLMQQPARANDCCHLVQSSCVARPTHFLPDCRAGTSTDQDCDTLCCIENELTDPCGGFIGPTCVANLTDAQCADTDGDGIIDDWETNGHDFNGNGVLDPGEDLHALGADPMKKDIFIEADCLVASDHSHCPSSLALLDVVRAYANAPVQNVDGTLGVQLHVDTGALYGAQGLTSVGRDGTPGARGNVGDMGGGGSQIAEAGNTIINYSGAGGVSYYTLKAANYNNDRAYVYRYMIWGHQTNGRRASNDCTSGQSESIPGNDFFVTLGGTDPNGFPCWTTDINGFSVGSRSEQGGTFMHELGHTLGLGHGGFDPTTRTADGTNGKPNYLSVMNYTFQDCLVPVSATGGLPGGCDYSRLADHAHGGPLDLDETNLDECIGIDGGLGFGAIDYNHNGVLQGATCAAPNTKNVIADINNDGACVTPGPNRTLESTRSGDDALGDGFISDGIDRVCQSTASGDDQQATNVGDMPGQENPLVSYNDWTALTYMFQTLSTFANGVSSPPPNDPDPAAIANARNALSALTEPSLTLTPSAPATILPGQTVTFSLKLESVGHGPALATAILDTLPDGSQTSIDVGTLPLTTSDTRTFQYQVPSNACPMNLVNVSNVSWIDMASAPYSSSARATTRVLDTVAPALSVSLSPNVLWPAAHQLVTVTATITATDNCDPHPTVKLISVVSSEPDNGLGDGDTPNDIQGATLGTDDRQLSLRAERSGYGTGRTYTATYEASDASGNKTRKQATVFVPMSK